MYRSSFGSVFLSVPFWVISEPGIYLICSIKINVAGAPAVPQLGFNGSMWNRTDLQRNQNRSGLWDLSGLDLRIWAIPREACGDQSNRFHMAGDHRGLVSGKYRHIVWTNVDNNVKLDERNVFEVRSNQQRHLIEGSVVWKHREQRGLKEHAGTGVGSQTALKTLFPLDIFHSVSLPPSWVVFISAIAAQKHLTPKTQSNLSEMPYRTSPFQWSMSLLIHSEDPQTTFLTRILILNSSSSPFYVPRFHFGGWYTTTFLNPLPHDRWLHSF